MIYDVRKVSVSGGINRTCHLQEPTQGSKEALTQSVREVTARKNGKTTVKTQFHIQLFTSLTHLRRITATTNSSLGKCIL